MAEYLANLSNGQIDEKGFLRHFGIYLNQTGVVQTDALAVKAQSTPDMSVNVSGGATGHDIIFITASGDTYHGWNTADHSVTISANSSGSTQYDTIVAYADLSVGSSTSNNPGGLKFIAVRGTGGVAATAAEVDAATGGNPAHWLAQVTVANGASSINSGNITDTRASCQIDGQFLKDGSVDTSQLADEAVTEAKQVVKSSFSTSEVNTGAKWIDGKDIYKKTVDVGTLPNSTFVDIPHGISNLDLVISIYGASTDGSNTIPLPNAHPSSAVAAFIRGSNITISNSTDRSAYTTSYVTILYTKT